MAAPAEKRLFGVHPKVVRADRETEITIRPRFGSHGSDRLGVDGSALRVTHFPVEQLAGEGGPAESDRPEARLEGGALRVRHRFEGEQEHVLLVEDIVEDVSGEKAVLLGDFRLYSLRDDLFARRAYKGDLHIHSCRSDGRDPPAYVAGACRRVGIDFAAITDHRSYGPSLEAKAAFDGVDIDLRLFPGEEVHPPENPIHIVNFGGGESVNDLFADESAYRSGVRAVEDALPALPAGVDRFSYASCVWCFERIREAGGLGIFCHPYWFTGHRYDAPGAMTSRLMEDQPYDALEVVGCTREAIELQVARYHEERAQGRRVPLVGVSDAHGCEAGERFGCCYTIVFSATPELGDLIDGVKGLYSVAVEDFPGEPPRAHGPFRLVKYAQFLFREVLPAHDEFAREEGRLMIEHASGDKPPGDGRSAADALAALKGRTAALYDRLWAD